MARKILMPDYEWAAPEVQEHKDDVGVHIGTQTLEKVMISASI